MKRLLAPALLLPVLLTACSSDPGLSEQYRYTPPTVVATNNTSEMDKPYDLAWARAERWFADKQLPLQSNARSSGLLAAEQTNYANGLDYLDCGSGGSKVAIEAPTLRVNLIITENLGKTVATVNVKGSTSVSFIDSDGSHVAAPSITPVCVSNGKLEEELMAALTD
ncbi:hypothetical protein ABHF91_14025 [Pseudaeromonas sp. ZJS20]|uniref:hypothetical protein n=1 Tax=Pseudaeromonas aegiceratis TaxID=3153928 RepID=UPI00390C7803